MRIYDLIVDGYCATYEYASAMARCGAVLSECGISTCEQPLHSRPEGPVINGIQVWYCYGADHYFFEDVTEDEE